MGTKWVFGINFNGITTVIGGTFVLSFNRFFGNRCCINIIKDIMLLNNSFFRMNFFISSGSIYIVLLCVGGLPNS